VQLHGFRKSAGAGAVLAAIVLGGIFVSSPQGRADDGSSEESEIAQGFAIAPVPLHLVGRNRALVGLECLNLHI
jgi:hypothetical protein